MITHYLARIARSLDHEGPAALCDIEAGLTEPPRYATLTSAILREVDCTDCLALLPETSS